MTCIKNNVTELVNLKKFSIFVNVKNIPKLMAQNIYTEKTVDAATGELTLIKTITKTVHKQEQFIKMYVEDLGSLIGCSNAEKNFLISVINLKYVEYETNEIVLNKARKESIAKMADVDYRSMQNCIYRLIKKNIIVKHESKLILNPLMFFNGSEKDRAKLFELKIQYKLK